MLEITQYNTNRATYRYIFEKFIRFSQVIEQLFMQNRQQKLKILAQDPGRLSEKGLFWQNLPIIMGYGEERLCFWFSSEALIDRSRSFQYNKPAKNIERRETAA